MEEFRLLPDKLLLTNLDLEYLPPGISPGPASKRWRVDERAERLEFLAADAGSE
jgi:hypothetical protein